MTVGNVHYDAQDLLKQYKMFSKSLKYISDVNDRSDICFYMDQLERDIIDITNISYEEKYKRIHDKVALFLDEEKSKLENLINIVTCRLNYVQDSINKHGELTGNRLDIPEILGVDQLDDYRNTIRIIDKYNHNIKLSATLVEEIKRLDKKIKFAKERIDGNKKLNEQLEEKMIACFEKAFQVIKISELVERREEVEIAYQELGVSLERAKENVRLAKLSHSSSLLMECDNMLSSTTLEYEKYKEKKYFLMLFDLYRNSVSSYEELLAKREEMEEILKNISETELYASVSEEFFSQLTTIKMEQQDLDTFNTLCEEKERKSLLLSETENENNSPDFKKHLDSLLKNEKKRRDELYLEQQKKEYAERQKKLLRDKEIQEERNRRQKLIEEERNKEIERRTKKLLEEKQKNEITREMPVVSNSDSVVRQINSKQDNVVTTEAGIPVIKKNLKSRSDLDGNDQNMELSSSSEHTIDKKDSWF